MNRMKWKKLLVALPAIGALLAAGMPATAAETNAVNKDKQHQEKIEKRMKARSHRKAQGTGAGAAADQAADATRVGGAATARVYHKGLHATKKGLNKAAKKTEKSTK